MRSCVFDEARWDICGVFKRTYELLPTSSLAPAAKDASAGFGLVDLGWCLFSSSAEESAILRRLSAGEDTEEVLRLLLPAGAYRSIERCLFLFLCLGGVGLLVGGKGTGESRSLLRLGLGLRRRPL